MSASLKPNHLQWTVDRRSRTFDVRVVEPSAYSPSEHGAIFLQCLSTIISPPAAELDPFVPTSDSAPDAFDLLSFPEAFAPADALVEALARAPAFDRLGCIHVGLRPDGSANHLFSVTQIEALVESIGKISRAAASDLSQFIDWLAVQRPSARINLGCLFAIDDTGDLRVCLHPKLVRSKFEASALHESHMTEADLVSLVTIRPTNCSMLSVTIQPLICSDALNLGTDKGTPGPIEALNATYCPIADPPDHVDIVSIVMCTPQPERQALDGSLIREWHTDYRESFCGAAKDGSKARHHFATFILANFATIESASAGLSGLFQPVDPRGQALPDEIDYARYGHDEGEADNRWLSRGDPPPKNWRGRAYTAGLRPLRRDDHAAVKVFGFSLSRLLRDASPWRPRGGPFDCKMLVGEWRTSSELSFSRWSDLP